jgi:hypothetical protein
MSLPLEDERRRLERLLSDEEARKSVDAPHNHDRSLP